jgi:glyoxylase-like metal-dependent hydrolase (beta-lactamase superfamily II)
VLVSAFIAVCAALAVEWSFFMKYNITKLADDLWSIDERFVCAFLIHGERGSLLIDACCSGGDEFFEAVNSITGGAPLKMAITHSDRDHIAGFRPEDTVYVHPAEYEHLGEHPFRITPLWDSDIFSAGNRTLTVMHIPGHTPGSVALIDEGNKKIFIGDSVSNSNIFMFGNGRNLDALIDSLNRLKTRYPDYDIYPSHGTAILPAAQIDDVIECALKIRAGEIVGEHSDMPCKLYRYKNAAILY